jgi:hypothetical protein
MNKKNMKKGYLKVQSISVGLNPVCRKHEADCLLLNRNARYTEVKMYFRRI